MPHVPSSLVVKNERQPSPMAFTTPLEEILINVGLDEKEAKIYLALLDVGNEKVYAIAKKAGIKRPTAYVILEQLYAKNYVIKTYHHKKVFYSAEQPEMLLQVLQEKERLFKESLPLLEARMTSSKVKPKVKIYEGGSGLEQVYNDIHTHAVVSFFGSIKYLSKEYRGGSEKLRKIIKDKDIHVRDLVTNDPKDIQFGLSYLSKSYDARVVPAGLDLFIDGAIYGDKVAIISIKKDLFAVVIESKEVADTFQTLFELSWKASEPLEAFKK